MPDNQFTTSLWGDEGFSAILSMKTIPEIISIIIKDTSPPLYNITEHLAFQFFGTGETVIRGLSFLYYLLTAFFVFNITGFLWGKKTALFSTLLIFLNPFFFIYAFEGRMYAILALGVTASMYFFLKRQWVPYVLATLWALYSHHFAIFALVVQGIWFVIELIWGNRGVAQKMFKAFVFVFIGYLPWIIPLYKQVRMVGGGFWLGKPTVDDLRNLTYSYLGKGLQHPLAEPALYVMFSVLLIRDWKAKVKETAFALSWFIIPIALTWLVSQKFQSIFYNRYLLFAIPGAMIIAASNRRVPASNILLGFVLLLFTIIDINYFNHPTKPPFRDLADYVKSTKRQGDYLVIWDAGKHKLWESKYYDIPAPIFLSNQTDLPYFVGTALMEDSDITYSIPENTQRVGVITEAPLTDINIDTFTRQQESKSFGSLNFVWLIK